MLQVIACRDIEVGEEITEDYDLDVWEMDERDTFDCACSSAMCRGRVHGFKFWDYADQCNFFCQLKRLDGFDIREKWLECHPEVMFHQLTLPNSIALTRGNLKSTHGLKIVATQSFEKGDVLYTVECLNADTKVFSKIILVHPHPDAPEVLMQTCVIDLPSKTLKENGEYEFCDVDEFKSMADDPNTFSTHIDCTRYTVTAKRDINQNEEITCSIIPYNV
jgi:hypothetical protein